MTLSSLVLTGECSPPSTFVLPRVQPPRLPKSGPYRQIVLVVVWSGPVGLKQLFTFYRLFVPGQQPARCSIYTVIVICEMADWWPDVMKKLFDCQSFFLAFEMTYFFSCWLFRSVFVWVKSIISPVKSSTDNRLLRGVIREGCLAVAGTLLYHQDH